MTRKTLMTHGVAFLAGCIMILALAVGVHLCSSRDKYTRAQELLKQWGVFLDDSQLLTISIPGRGMLVRIRSSHTGDDTAAGDIEVLHEKVGAVFEFRWRGPYGRPAANYGGGVLGHGHFWVDNNADGMFDKHFDFSQKRVYIRTRDGWMLATTIADRLASTPDGRFAFSVDSGEWERINEE